MSKTEAGSIDLCKFVDLPVHADDRGRLSFAEGRVHIGFDINRVYYLYDIPAGGERGAHGHRALEQLFLALSGSFDVEINDGLRRRTFKLDNPARGLYVCPMIWRDLRNFSPGAVCLVLASDRYDEGDYFRDYDQFLRAARTR